ncbi:MAG: DUF5011 domain-containing protein [Chitinophagaceae bacterium]
MHTISKRYLYLPVLALLLIMGSCKKETTKGVSKTLKVPVIELKGDALISIAPGSTYTDQGATYFTEDGTEEALAASSNEVNPAVPGLYFVTYEKESGSGIFHTVATRVVAVAYQGNTVDYSGTYLREATGMNAYVTRLLPGFYQVQNPGGATGAHTGVKVYFIETAANTFAGPPQPNDLVGDIEFADIVFTSTGASWRIINNPYYGTGTRTFVKQ